MRGLAALALLSALPVFLAPAVAQQALKAEADEVARAVATHSDWARDALQCPTRLMAPRGGTSHLQRNDCTPGRLSQCLAACTAGSPGGCYWLGQALQGQGVPVAASEALHQRSCRLGVMSGCTNRAAGMLKEAMDDEAARSCAAATFEAVCAHDDPWACTMLAFHLSRGIGIKQDTKRALKVLEKSCKYGPEDEACAIAGSVRREIERSGGQKGAGKP